MRRALDIAYGFLILAALGWMCAFMAAPVEPFGFYKDLGFNWETVDWAVHTLRRPIDLLDAIGWAPWNSSQTLYLNSYIGEIPTILASFATGNSWLAIKIVEGVQMICACVAAYALFRTRGGTKRWSLACGALYAALPATAFTIRWNTDFGWIVVAMPAAFAAANVLIGRFGTRSLPLVGALWGFAGYVLALQFLAFVSLPGYVICLASLRLRSAASALHAVAGFCCCLAVGAFFMIPSFLGPPYSDSAVRLSSLERGSFLALFSNEWLGLIALVQREWYASPLAAFNASNSLGAAAAIGTVLWILAIGFLATDGDRRRSFATPGAIVITGACVVLSLGSNVPFGSDLWHLLYSVPHVNGIRTTDRFLMLVPVLLTLWAVAGLERLAARYVARGDFFRLLALALTCTAIGIDVQQHVFTLSTEKGEREPQLDAVASVVAAAGGRTLPLATANGGSVEDAPVYGRPAPVDAYVDTDLASRYLNDGIAGAGIFSRLAIRTVITTPNWAYDTPLNPSTTNVLRVDKLARPIFKSAENVGVFALPARAMLETTRIACVWGGPGAYDHLLAAPALADVALAQGGAGCDESGLIDFDPYDAALPSALQFEPASRLLPAAALLNDKDYVVAYNRTLLAIPWYRNAIGGTRPLLDTGGTRSIDATGSLTFRIARTLPRAARVALRFASHVEAIVSLEIDGRRLGVADVGRNPGLHWLAFETANGVPAGAVARINFDVRAPAPDTSDTWPGLAIDGVAIFAPNLAPPRFPAPLRFVAMTVPAPPLAAKRDEVALSPWGRAGSLRLAGFAPVSIAGKFNLLASSERAAAHYRWPGPSGRYVIALRGQFEGDGQLVSIGAGGQRTSATLAGDAVLATRPVRLHSGSSIDVGLAGPAFVPDLANRISDLRVLPWAPLAMRYDSRKGYRREVQFATALEAYRGLLAADNVVISPDGISGRTGSRYETALRIPTGAAALLVRLSKSGDGRLEASLACGNARVSRAVETTATTLELSDLRPGTCRIGLAWQRGSAAVTGFTATLTGATFGARSLRAWLPQGTFERRILQPNGDVTPGAGVAWPGCPPSRSVCTRSTAGFATVALDGSVPPGAIVLLSRGAAAAAASLSVTPTAAERWHIRVNHATSIVLAELNDGSWHLRGERSNASGSSCNIAATCFSDVPPGTYDLRHEYPKPLVIGLAVTAATLAIALLTLVLGARRNKAFQPTPVLAEDTT